jgi:uridine kinase
MIGDVILIKPEYHKTAKVIFDTFSASFFDCRRVIAVAGESGSGKSVTAICLQKELIKNNIDALILHQDDYFFLPPYANHMARVEDLKRVGEKEVNLQLLQTHINAFLNNEEHIVKPLINYKENQILQDTLNISPYQVLIIEGTYSFLLEKIDTLIFMERNFTETLENRLKRSRDINGEFLESVLKIEHEIIAKGIKKANIIVRKDYSVTKVE